MDSFRLQLSRIWRRWPLVLVIMIAATAAAGYVTQQGGTNYTSRASLIAASSGRSPDQDAVLVQGFVDYFNDEVYQARIREQAKVPSTVHLSARTAAASPIVIIEATSPDSSTIAADVAAVTLAFRDDMNNVNQTGKEQWIAAMQAQLDDAKAAAGPTPQINDLAQISDLQNKIQEAQSTSTSQLQELTIDGGFSTTTPPLYRNLLGGLVGGALLGVLAALGAARLSTRVDLAADMYERLGLRVLAEIPAGKNGGAEQLRVLAAQHLANRVVASESRRPLIVAVVTSDANRSGYQVAEAIVEYRGQLGDRIKLIDATQGQGTAAAMLALEDALSGRAEAPPDVVVIAAPPANSTAEAQVLCASATTTLLVLEKGVTKMSAAAQAVDTLRQVHVSMLGVVLISPADESLAVKE